MKVLHLPSPVGGMAWGLSQGERALGLDSRVLVRMDNWLQYPCDFRAGLEATNSNIVRAGRLLRTFLRFKKGYDVYHFNFGSSLLDIPQLGLNLIDLPFYDRKARLFVTYNGCDARQKYATMERTGYSACHEADCYNGYCMNPKRDARRRKRIARMNQFVRQVFAVNPDLLWFLPPGSQFLPYAVTGFDEIAFAGPIGMNKKLKILHAPTQRGAKGTEYIIKAVEELLPRYPQVEFILVENLSHQEALRKYAEADLVIDQVLVGWYGGLAVEVMKMGKPVIAYIREEDLAFIPEAMRRDLPVISADRDSLPQVLAFCIENPDYLREKAQASLDFVNRWHDPRYVASIVKEHYEK